MQAAWGGHFSVAELLLQHGARVQHADEVIRGRCACVGEELCLVVGMLGIRGRINVPGYYEQLQAAGKVRVSGLGLRIPGGWINI